MASSVKNYPGFVPPPKAKGRFPFRIGATSFLVPDYMAPNVRLVAGAVDDVELLFYESREDSLPTAAEVAELKGIAADHELTYTIHLPVDVKLGAADPDGRKRAIEGHLRAIDRALPIANLFVVHPDGRDGDGDVDFPMRIGDALAALAPRIPSHIPFCVENLLYPFTVIEPVISGGRYPVCVDTGHLYIAGHSSVDHWTRVKDAARIVHLHGARDGKDHLSLAKGDPVDVDLWLARLADFRGVVCLEVFNAAHLAESLQLLLGRLA